MAENSLLTICSKQEQEGQISRFYCTVLDDFYGFRGHFEGQPVLPGVCQLRLVVEAVTHVHGAPSIKCIEKVKFHNLIVPNTSFVIEIEAVPAQWKYRIFNKYNDFASGKIISR